MSAPITIQRADETDLDAVLDIWSARPKKRPDIVEHRAELRCQLAALERPFGCWLAKRDGAILGWVSLVPACAGLGFAGGGIAGELSCYIASDVRARGLGSALMRTAVESAVEGKLDSCLGWIAAANTASKAISRRSGGRYVESFAARPKNLARQTMELWIWDCNQLELVRQ